MRYLVLVLAALAMPLLAGEFESDVTGYVKADRNRGVEGAIASVHPDPMWGCADEAALARFKEKHPDLPEKVTITGSGYTNRDGKFQFKAKVSWKDGEVPVKSYRSRDGEDVKYAWVPVLLKATAEGYVEGRSRGVLNDGYVSSLNVTLEKLSSLKGRVVHAESGKPAAGLKLILQAEVTQMGRVTEVIRHELTTGDDGAFQFSEARESNITYGFRIAGRRYAFKPGSGSRRSVTLYKGNDNDLGTLEIVPGGGVTLRWVDEDSGKPVKSIDASLKLIADDRDSFHFKLTGDDEGRALLEAIPAGHYRLSDFRCPEIRRWHHFMFDTPAESYWPPHMDEFEVRPGELVDLGDISLEPYRTIDIHAFGPDGGLMYYEATATYLGDAPPPLRFRADATITSSARLSAELTALGKLFAGEWRITVKAEGLTEARTRVRIPADEPLRMTLTRPASIEFEAVNHEGASYFVHWALAARQGTPAYDDLSRFSVRELSGAGYLTSDGELPVGVYRKGSEPGRIENVRPGTYLVVISDGRGGLFRKFNVEVKEGEVVKLSFRPEPGKLIARLVNGGSPVPGETLVLRRQRDGEDDEVIRLATDADGKAEYEVTRDSQPRNGRRKYFDCILTEREHDWIEKHTDRFPWHMQNFAARKLQLSVGEQTEFTIDLAETAFVFVTVRVGEGESVSGIHLRRPGEDEAEDPRFVAGSALRFIRAGDRYGAICVPAGSYEVAGSVSDATWDQRHVYPPSQVFSHEIVVKGGEDQDFEFKVEVRRLEIQLDAPDGTNLESVSVFLAPQSGYLDYRNPRTPDAEGRVNYPCIPEGDYRVTAVVMDEAGGVKNAASTLASVPESGTVSAKLKLRDDVGAVEIDIKPLPEQARGFRGAVATVRFRNADGEIVEPGLPSSALSRTHRFTVPAVPAGTYTVEIAVPEGLPCKVEDVRVNPGETVGVNVEPEPAGMLKLNLENVHLRWDAGMTVAYEDDNGEPVKHFLPEGSLGWMKKERGRAECVLINLTPEVKQVRINISHFKEIVLKVNVKAGETVTRDMKFD